MELNRKQIERQDFVDNSIFELLNNVNPTLKNLEWNIEIISEVREVIRIYFENILYDFPEQDFYPYKEQ